MSADELYTAVLVPDRDCVNLGGYIMDHDVFISFSFQDQLKAEEIANRLTSEYGISCWICTREIAGGSHFR